MKRIFSFVLAILFISIFASPVFAHVLKYDGSIGAVLHVNPEDDPIAGEISNFFFEFKDKNNKFLPENCDCKITILKEGQEVLSRNLFENNFSPSLDNISFSYTFPALGIYTLNIDGKSKDGSFNDFSLKYDIRVARLSESQDVVLTNQEDNWFLKHKLHIFIPSAIFILTLVGYVLTRKRKS